MVISTEDFCWTDVSTLPRYAHGKKENTIPFQVIKQKVQNAKLNVEDEAFFWLLYYCGVRKSEAYERVADDFKINPDYIIIDFHQRKKGGKTVPPLELPRHWYGVPYLIDVVKKAKEGKPRKKSVYLYIEKKRTRQIRKDRWVFPHIQSTKAWDIVRRVLGRGYYPHFLRLNRLTEIGRDPTASLTRLSSFSGIKSVTALNEYLGADKKEQQKAIEFMDKEYS